MIGIKCDISTQKAGSVLLSPLKTQLMNEIRQDGSASDAVRKMEITYQHIWMMFEEMNGGSPLATVQPSGITKNGGSGILGYSARRSRESQIIEAHIRRVVDQINFEINL